MARWSVSPNMTSPCEVWSISDLQRLESLGNQIDALNAEIARLDDAFNGADMAGDTRQCCEIESRADELIALLVDLQSEYNSIGNDEYGDDYIDD